MVKRTIAALLATFGVAVPLHALADSVSVTFGAWDEFANGSPTTLSVPDPTVTFTLESNGTIQGNVSVSGGFVNGVAINVNPSFLPGGESVIGSPWGQLDDWSPTGSQLTSWSWTIGTPGEFTSVFQLPLQPNSGGYTVLVDEGLSADVPGDLVYFAGNTTVPLPAAAWLLLSGLGVLRLAGRRRLA